MVGSRTGLGSGLVWLESVGNKWTEQGLFLQGSPLPITHWAWQPQLFPGPGDLGAFLTTLPQGPCFLLDSQLPSPRTWENCPKSTEKAGWKFMPSLLGE